MFRHYSSTPNFKIMNHRDQMNKPCFCTALHTFIVLFILQHLGLLFNVRGITKQKIWPNCNTITTQAITRNIELRVRATHPCHRSHRCNTHKFKNGYFYFGLFLESFQFMRKCYLGEVLFILILIDSINTLFLLNVWYGVNRLSHIWFKSAIF